MTIHTTHPFLEPEGDRDPVRRLRGRLGATVSLWTAGSADARAGLTVSSWLVAGGEPGRVLALLDPDADLTDVLLGTGRGIVALPRDAPRKGTSLRLVFSDLYSIHSAGYRSRAVNSRFDRSSRRTA